MATADAALADIRRCIGQGDEAVTLVLKQRPIVFMPCYAISQVDSVEAGESKRAQELRLLVGCSPLSE